MTEREIIIYYIGFYAALYRLDELKERLAKQAGIEDEVLIDEVLETVKRKF
jgi:hypothetical protein